MAAAGEEPPRKRRKSTGGYCSAVGCRNNYRDNPAMRFFCFPVNQPERYVFVKSKVQANVVMSRLFYFYELSNVSVNVSICFHLVHSDRTQPRPTDSL